MTTKIDKKDLKSPDKFQQELQKGFQWTTQHSKIVGMIVLGFMVLGAGLSAKSYMDDRKENELQAKYYQVEKKLVEKKTAFETAKAQPPADPKAKTPPPPAGEKATGDFEKDYGPIAEELAQIVDQSPGSNAAKMAALNLAEIQLEYQKTAEAKAILEKVKTGSRDLLSGLVQVQLGTVQADLNNCTSAVDTWQKVLANTSAKALHGAVKLKSGICYESMNDLAKAEKLYSEAKSEDKESATARAAEKYLRLLPTAKKE